MKKETGIEKGKTKMRCSKCGRFLKKDGTCSNKANHKKYLVLRSDKPDGISKNGFKWPESGYVEAPDWRPTKECGNGLHGQLDGKGNNSLLYNGSDAIYRVVEIEEYIDLNGKVKFPNGNVVYCGNMAEALRIIIKHKWDSGNSSKAASSGDNSTAASSGYSSTAASSGDNTISVVAGLNGSAKAGPNGCITLHYFDGKRNRAITGYVGEGIDADTWYVVKDGKLVRG